MDVIFLVIILSKGVHQIKDNNPYFNFLLKYFNRFSFSFRVW